MLGIKSFIAIALPQIFKFIQMITDTKLLDMISTVADYHANGSCRALCDLRAYFT